MGKRDRSCTPTEPDCVPTELDETSGDEVPVIDEAEEQIKDKATGKDNHDPDINFPSCLTPYLHWTSMRAKYLKCLSVSRPDHNIMFDLCPPHENMECHFNYALDKILGLGQYKNRVFKFGISSQPGVRWSAFPDYKFLDVMLLVYTSENSDDTARLEIEFIKKFRNDARLQNRSPGGENAHCGCSPHFLYIVFGWRHQFADGRVLAGAR